MRFHIAGADIRLPSIFRRSHENEFIRRRFPLHTCLLSTCLLGIRWYLQQFCPAGADDARMLWFTLFCAAHATAASSEVRRHAARARVAHNACRRRRHTGTAHAMSALLHIHLMSPMLFYTLLFSRYVNLSWLHGVTGEFSSHYKWHGSRSWVFFWNATATMLRELTPIVLFKFREHERLPCATGIIFAATRLRATHHLATMPAAKAMACHQPLMPFSCSAGCRHAMQCCHAAW